MTYRNSYRRGYRASRPVTPGRVTKVNARPGPCRYCGEAIPAGAGQLWREDSGAWSVVHAEETQGGWLMHPQPVRGGCPEATDRRNAEMHANGFLGPDTPAPASERENIAATAARYAARQASDATPARRSYARTSGGAWMSERCSCEDYPCCGH